MSSVGDRPAQPRFGDADRLAVVQRGDPDRLAGVHALHVGRVRRVEQHLAGGERGVPAGGAVVGGHREPAHQLGPVRRVDRELVAGGHALQHQQPGRGAEVRHQDVDQAAGHLVQVQGRADLAERVIQQRVPHQRGIDEPLGRSWRHAQHGQRGQARFIPVAEHRLDAGHRLHPAAFPGADRQDGGGLAPRLDRLEQLGQRGLGRAPAGHQVAQVGADQGIRVEGQDLGRVSVMLNDPSVLIDAEDEGPHGYVR